MRPLEDAACSHGKLFPAAVALVAVGCADFLCAAGVAARAGCAVRPTFGFKKVDGCLFVGELFKELKGTNCATVFVGHDRG